jgi:hypothetical protein
MDKTGKNIPESMVFVYGSNEAGRHGRGAALEALHNHGAIYGCGFGHVGQSYGIPTKDINVITLPIFRVEQYITAFLQYADYYYDFNFKVTRIGCGLAGFNDREIAPLFRPATPNCYFDEAWLPCLGPDFKYWGTYA